MRRRRRVCGDKILALERELRERWGSQGWWPTTRRPGEAPRYTSRCNVLCHDVDRAEPTRRRRRCISSSATLEIIVGAILTQNTAWSNVVKALKNLTAAGRLNLDDLEAAGPWLEECIRSSGYYRQKARRLRLTSAAIRESGGLEALRRLPTDELRSLLLRWHGVGKETADSILCYAFQRPVFVVDAYTGRLFRERRLPHASYDEMQSLVHESLPPDADRLGEFHALIVCNFTCNPTGAR